MATKIQVEIEFKRFRGNNREDRGLYTPAGRRSNRARIEINTRYPIVSQIWALFHEVGHFVCDQMLGRVHKEDPKETEREHKFCDPIANAAERAFQAFMRREDDEE